MNAMRFTRGITSSGRAFEFHDDWTVPNSAHKLLDEPWIGSTIFLEKNRTTLSDLDYGQVVDLPKKLEKKKWSDLIDE